MNTLIINSLDELPKKLKAARINQNMSQSKLAQLAGIGLKTVYTAETGAYTPHVAPLLDIVKALGYDSIEFRLENLK